MILNILFIHAFKYTAYYDHDYDSFFCYKAQTEKITMISYTPPRLIPRSHREEKWPGNEAGRHLSTTGGQFAVTAGRFAGGRGRGC